MPDCSPTLGLANGADGPMGPKRPMRPKRQKGMIVHNAEPCLRKSLALSLAALLLALPGALAAPLEKEDCDKLKL